MTISLLSVFMMASSGCKNSVDNESNKWCLLISEHLSSYPEMQITDVYKLVYQSIMGPAHMGTDIVKIKDYLSHEISDISASERADLIENISPSGAVIRVDLKRIKAEDGNIHLLAEAIARSASGIKPDTSMLENVWHVVGNLIKNGSLRQFTRAEFEAFTREIEKTGYPAAHHSEIYHKRYSPAYRVLLREEWENICSEFFQ